MLCLLNGWAALRGCLGPLLRLALAPAVLAGLCGAGLTLPLAVAQEEVRPSLAGETAAEMASKGELPANYNLRYGPLLFRLRASVVAELNDNVIFSEVNRRQDLILRPDVAVDALWPITGLNALTFSLGVGYAFYPNNAQLNGDAPMISPGSEIALQLFIKDFRIRLHERFSYQESLYWWGAYSYQSGEFYNLGDIGKFGRFRNLAGFDAAWDLHDLVLTLGYDHETFLSMRSSLDYLTRESELFSLSADFILAPRAKTGLESKASWNDYETDRLPDHWRASVGPFVDVWVSPYVGVRAGAGYEAIPIPRVSGQTWESDPNTYYAYGRVSHRVNKNFSYGLGAGRENQLGWSSHNMPTTYVRIGANWKAIRNVDLSAYFSAGFAKESGAFWTEDFSYYQAGINLGYRFAQRWTATLAYDYSQRDSERAYRDYYQNRLSLGLVFRF